MPWSSLPEELWKLIFLHISLPERLGTCSRVSKKLRRAAAAATEQLELQLQRSQQRSEGVVQWLQHRGKHVTSLALEDFDASLTELPCRQLHQLVVSRGKVQLGPSSTHPGVLHSSSGLTMLRLHWCRVFDGPNRMLSSLSAAPALQHLELNSNWDAANDQLHLPGSILQVLTQLTLLSLDRSIEVTAESLQHISALQHLQVLDLSMPSVALSPSCTPGLAQLTGLHTLKVVHIDEHPMDAAVLQHHTGLRQLKLLGGLSTGCASGAVLLSVAGQQLQLQELNLVVLRCQWPIAAAAYTALTVSSRLQELKLRLFGVPAGFWQAVFRPQQQLPNLHKVMLHCWGAASLNNEGIVPPLLGLGITDISRVAACCPGLQYLDIDLQPDAQLAALSQLTALTYLSISKATESSVKSLSGLSVLQSLSIHGSAPFRITALQPLTALRQLTSLEARPVWVFYCVDLKHQTGDSAPVWQQLPECCQPARGMQSGDAAG